MRILLALLSPLPLAAPLAAQHIVYDAGSAGSPPVAPDPRSMGWNLVEWNGLVDLNPISPDSTTGLNAWEVADNSTSGRAVYEASFFPPPDSFEFTATMRMTAGPTNTIFMEYQDGVTLTDCRFRAVFRIVGSDVIVTDWFGSAGTPELVCTNGAGTYHTYALRLGPGTFSVELLYDGAVLGHLTGGIPVPGSNESARWGAASDAGVGRARFHRVEFAGVSPPIHLPAQCGGTVPNSTGLPALLSATGSRTIGGPGFLLSASAMPPNQFGYFLLSTDLRSAPGLIPPGSQGRLCLGPGSVGRFSRPGEILFTGSGGAFELDVDTLDVPTNPPGPLTPGPWHFQAWFRDTNPGTTSNFTDPIRIIFQ